MILKEDIILVMTSGPGTGAAGAKVLLVGGQVGPHHGQLTSPIDRYS